MSNYWKVGYARVSTKEQNLEMQLDALKKEGCDKLFVEKISGRSKNRPQFEEMKKHLRTGDTVVVYSLARLGRTSKELINLLHEFNENGIGFKSIKEGSFDTSTAFGRAIAGIWSVIIGMEVEVLSERTKDGLEAARARGRKGGRPAGSIDKTNYHAVCGMYKSGATWTEIEKDLKVSRSTIRSYLIKEGLLKSK